MLTSYGHGDNGSTALFPSEKQSTPAHVDTQAIADGIYNSHAVVEQSVIPPARLTDTSSSQTTSVSIPLENHNSAAMASPVNDADPPLSKARTVRDEEPTTELAQTSTSNAGPPYTIFTLNQKRFIVFMASWAGFFSPVSANIYLPALNALSLDLNVSNSLINLTLTSYMIFQGLAPAFIGNLADSMGRRPAYFVCFVLYLVANIALALQNSYAALFVLRCLQSSGSSGTIAMSSAVVADISTPADRGLYMGFVLAGSLFGPAIGPVLGGILTQFLGWRAIFWFLVILAAAFLVIFAIFFPETGRQIVGNGSIPARGLNMSLMNYIAIRKARKTTENSAAQSSISDPSSASSQPTPRTKTRFPNPLSSLKILFDKENALLLFYNGFMFAAFYDMTAIIASEFHRVYRFNDLQVGLCYIPFGFGSMLAALINGQLLDRSYRRWCGRLGVEIKKGRDQDLRDFPIEKARLELAIPATYVGIAMVLVFGWVLDKEGPLAAMLVILFIAAFSLSIAFNAMSTLLVDFYPTKPATATAANNLVRCLLGAGATGVVAPMVNSMGLGWCFTFLSLFLLATSPMLWLVTWRGMKWREERRLKEEAMQQKLDDSRPTAEEEGGRLAENSEETLAVGGPPEMVGVAADKKTMRR